MEIEQIQQIQQIQREIKNHREALIQIGDSL